MMPKLERNNAYLRHWSSVILPFFVDLNMVLIVLDGRKPICTCHDYKIDLLPVTVQVLALRI